MTHKKPQYKPGQCIYKTDIFTYPAYWQNIQPDMTNCYQGYRRRGTFISSESNHKLQQLLSKTIWQCQTKLMTPCLAKWRKILGKVLKIYISSVMETANNNKQPKRFSIVQCLNTLGYSHTMNYKLTMNLNKLPLATVWLTLRNLT